MFGRRSHARFAISGTSEGVLRVLRDVIVQHIGGAELIAISREPGVIGETLALEVAEQDNPFKTIVRVLESRPVVIDGTVRHRLRLQDAGDGDQSDVVLQAFARGTLWPLMGTDILAVLTKELQVRFLNCSSSGCLVESDTRIPITTVGSLRLVMGGRHFVDDVQVVRCVAIKGSGSVYHVGARFLWTAPPDNHSLRSAMRLMTTERTAWVAPI